MNPRRSTRLLVAKPAADPTLYRSALDEARVQAGLSGAQLAANASVDPTSTWEIMTRYKRQGPGSVRSCQLDTAQRLAQAVGQEWTALFEWRDPEQQADSQRVAELVTLRAYLSTAFLTPEQAALNTGSMGKLLRLLQALTPEEMYAAQQRYQALTPEEVYAAYQRHLSSLRNQEADDGA